MKIFSDNRLINRTLKTLQYIFAFGVLIVFGRFVINNWGDFQSIFTVRLQDIVLLLGAFLLYSLAAAGRFASIYRSLGAKIGIIESFGLSSVASALNLLLPARPGAIARALYLKRRYGIPLSQGPTILFGSLLFSLFMGGVGILVISSFLTLLGNSVPALLWLAALAASTSVFLLWFSFPKSLTARLGRLGNWLQLFSDGWNSLKNDKRIFAQTAFFQALEMVLSGWAIMISYNSMGSELNIFMGIVIGVFMSFVNFINITPGNIGLSEIIFGYLTELTGGTFVEGVAAGTILRLGGYILIFTAAPIAWYFLFYRQNIAVRTVDTE